MISAHILTDQLAFTIKITIKEPVENGQKESSEELSQVETTTGQNRVHPIAVFPLEMIPFQPMIRFQVTKDRFNGGASGMPFP
jgi:hypothetical protein